MDFSIDESPAIKALGPLFSLTEVHLWDDGSIELDEAPDFQEPSKLINCVHDSERSDSSRTNGIFSLSEDVELAKRLNDLGLPLSFGSNKEKRNGSVSGRRKGSRKSNQQFPVEIDEKMLDSIKVSEEENISHANLVDTSKFLNQVEILKNEIVIDLDGLSNLSLEREDSVSSTACNSTLSNEHDYNGEVSDLRSGNKILDEANIQCRNEKVSTGLCQDDGTSEESCLINEGVDSDGKGIKGELDSVLEGSSSTDHETEGQSNDISFEAIEVHANSDVIENHQTDSSGEWIACWDDLHMRTYFYNFKTEESTWDPPLGMEHLGYCSNIADEPTSTVDGMAELANDQSDYMKSNEVEASSDIQPYLNLAIESRNDDGLIREQLDEITGNLLYEDNLSSTNATKRKKKVRRTKSNRKLSVSSEDLHGVSQEIRPSINKYWCQRYLLFSRFDYGIKMDEEGWFSVTPESIAKHHAVRCGNGTIVDLFTGVGGNAIQFAQWSKHVTAIDIDPNKIDYARHNAAIYGVDDNIDFIKGDCFSLAPKLKANTVFMSPPWGGPDYSKVKKFDINTMLKPRDGHFLFNVGKEIAPFIVMFLPRNVDINQLAELSLSATPPWSLEVERNFLNGRLKAVTAYFIGPSKR